MEQTRDRRGASAEGAEMKQPTVVTIGQRWEIYSTPARRWDEFTVMSVNNGRIQGKYSAGGELFGAPEIEPLDNPRMFRLLQDVP